MDQFPGSRSVWNPKARATLVCMPGSTASEKTAIDGRYRALLDVSSAIAEQPTVKAVLHSLRGVLSSTCRSMEPTSTSWAVTEKVCSSWSLIEKRTRPRSMIGTKILRIGAAARVLEEQEPVFLPDVSQEMLKHPELAPFAPQSVGRSTYLFPVSTSQERYGILVVTKERGQEFVPEDVELLRSLASHVAVALECALARDRCRALSA